MESWLHSKLVNSVQEIACLDTLTESAFSYNPIRWVNLENQEALNYTKCFNGSNISRKDVILAFHEYYSGKIETGVKAFLYSLIWGFTESGYGPYRTNTILQSENAIKLFEKGLNSINKGENEVAFNSLMGIKGLNISYVSKVMYFATKALAEKEEQVCLIFDSKVANNLLKIALPSEFISMFTILPNKTYKGYVAYNNMMHTLAKKLNVDADALELYIFNLSSNKQKNV